LIQAEQPVFSVVGSNVKVVVNSHTTVIAGVYLIAKEGSYTPIKLAHNHTSLCILRYQSYDHDVWIDTRDATYYRVPESPLYPMDIHLLSVHHILLYILQQQCV
jgi:hypothetical protein